MIDFTRAFDSAWERMMVILFRPFDLGKWFVIGLSAFLAGLLNGGNGFNGGSYNNSQFGNGSGGNQFSQFNLHQFNTHVTNMFTGVQLGLIILVAGVVLVVFLVFTVLLYWLGARGQFLFLDNIVRNRGAIAAPWRFYTRPTNSLFFFLLIIFAIALAIVLCLMGIVLMVGLPLYLHHRWPNSGEITVLVILAVLYLAFCVVFGSIFFVFKEFGVPLMFRNGLMALPAFQESMRLFKNNPGSVVVFILLRMALWLALLVVSIAVCCMTCCVALLPYLGTVALLPALIYIRCFTLDCLAQFGPQYDVWTVDVSPPGFPASPIFSPPPPPG